MCHEKVVLSYIKAKIYLKCDWSTSQIKNQSLHSTVFSITPHGVHWLPSNSRWIFMTTALFHYIYTGVLVKSSILSSSNQLSQLYFYNPFTLQGEVHRSCKRTDLSITNAESLPQLQPNHMGFIIWRQAICTKLIASWMHCANMWPGSWSVCQIHIFPSQEMDCVEQLQCFTLLALM